MGRRETGRASRSRGVRYERRIARHLGMMTPEVEVKRGYQFRGGRYDQTADVEHPAFWVECKSGRNISVPASLRQMLSDTDGRLPVLFYHYPNRKQPRDLVIMPDDVLAEMVEGHDASDPITVHEVAAGRLNVWRKYRELWSGDPRSMLQITYTGSTGKDLPGSYVCISLDLFDEIFRHYWQHNKERIMSDDNVTPAEKIRNRILTLLEAGDMRKGEITRRVYGAKVAEIDPVLEGLAGEGVITFEKVAAKGDKGGRPTFVYSLAA